MIRLVPIALGLGIAGAAPAWAQEVTFSAGGQIRSEADGAFAVTVQLDAVQGVDVQVPFSVDGTALEGFDYSISSSPLTIPAGQPSGDVIVNLIDDPLPEQVETILIQLGSPSQGSLGAPSRHLILIEPSDLGLGSKYSRASISLPVTVTPDILDLGSARVGASSAPQSVLLTNYTPAPITVTAADIVGRKAGDFSLSPSTPFPIVLPSGQSESLDITFTPAQTGLRTARVVVRQTPYSILPIQIQLAGQGNGPTGAEVLVNSGGGDYLGENGEIWRADYGHGGISSVLRQASGAISAPADLHLYRSTREGPSFDYGFDLPNGTYDVTLHFIELTQGPGQRVFDVTVEGQLFLDDFEVLAAAGGLTGHTETTRAQLSDGRLEIDLTASVGVATISAVEIRSVGELQLTPGSLDFGLVDVGSSVSMDVTLQNVGLHTLHADTLSFRILAGNGSDFSADLSGTVYAGSSIDIDHPIDLTLLAGEMLVVPVTFAPLEHGHHDIELAFQGDFDEAHVDLTADSGVGGHPYLHPVILVDPIVVDYDSSGSELTVLDASDSHTHEPGRVLTAWEWRESSNLISSLEVDALPFALGAHTVELTIYDDNTPPQSLATTEDFQVVPVSQVPGVLALYYQASPPTTTATTLLDAFPLEADFGEILASVDVTSVAGGIGSSGLTADVMVRLSTRFDVQTPGLFDFIPSGGVAHRIDVDGTPFITPISLGAGLHDLELRWAVDSLADLPLGLAFTVDGGAAQSFLPAELFHDQTTTVPVINSMPQAGVVGGGNQIIISGFGFFPQNSVTVHWGGTDLTSANFTSWSAESLAFLSPPGSAGFINVTVETPVGTSNTVLFEYQNSGPVPISFISGPKPSVTQPTAADWGPDGRLYVTSRDGTLRAFTFSNAYGVQSAQTYPGVSALSNHEIMGIAFNPFDPPSPIKLYVSHGEMYAQGGGSFTGPAPYTGQVSVLTGPNFDTPVPLISNLPTSNHDHGVNGMVFDNNGDLLLTVGSNTNAGVIHPNIGDLPESPFSAAILKAQTSRPDFAGDLMYVETVSGLVNNDQVFGDIVDPIPGRHVSVHSAGIRNPFDLVLTTWGRLYATDNGPNKSFGVASLSATTQTSVHPEDTDELLLVEYDHYYGSPNRNRGRSRTIENVYLNTLAPPQAGFTQALASLPSSQNGLIEYRSAGFGGQLRGDLMVLKFNGVVKRVQLSADKRSVTSVTPLDPTLVAKGLNLRAGPGGALITIDYNGNKLRVSLPNDASISGPTVLDITPWRAANTGTTPFVIGGENFGTLADTTVSIDGQPATLTSVDSRRIVGTFPLHPSPPSGLVTVTVTVAGTPLSLDQAVQFLPPTPGLWPGRWESATDMPMALGEVACGIIDGVVFVVGEGSSNTLAWDRLTDTWNSNRAVRPFQGHHHAAEVHQGKWFLIGGLAGNSKGKLQIYDPVLDQWTLGAGMPWNGGSVSTALIDGKIYAAGGIVGSTTVDNCAVYDIALDTWTSLTPMPSQQGRNHAASGTDGSRFFIFGGRGIGSGAGNTVANGYADVQIYDPATDTWTTSLDPGSTLNPMPIGRGGTGKAVFYKGEFHVFGGETLNGPGAQPGNVYDRVDVYDPVANTWRLEAPMPTPRHGIFPLLWQGKILLPGGGVVAGFSSSDKNEIYDRQ